MKRQGLTTLAVTGAVAALGAVLACNGLLDIQEAQFDPAVNFTCEGGLTACGLSCVDLTASDEHCGACDRPCRAPAGGSAACVADEGGTCFRQCELPAAICGDACVDRASDPEHCGACGHSCQGGACEEGKCRAVELASELAWPVSLAVDDERVYWTEQGGPGIPPGVGFVAKRGIPCKGATACTVFAVREDGGPSTIPRSIVNDGRETYVSYANVIANLDVASRQLITRFAATNDQRAMAVTDKGLFWGSNANDEFLLFRPRGATSDVILMTASGGAPRVGGVLVLGDTVLVAVRDARGSFLEGVYQVEVGAPCTGAGCTMFAASDDPRGLALVDGWVYWVAYDRTEGARPQSWVLLRKRPGGGGCDGASPCPQRVVYAMSTPGLGPSFVVDGARIHYLTDSEVRRVDWAGAPLDAREGETELKGFDAVYDVVQDATTLMVAATRPMSNGDVNAPYGVILRLAK